MKHVETELKEFAPKKPKPRRATKRELAMWLARGNGEMSSDHPAVSLVINNKPYEKKHGEDPVDNDTIIRKWEDADWHEPTVDYMFGMSND